MKRGQSCCGTKFGIKNGETKDGEHFKRRGRIFRWSPQDGELVLREGRCVELRAGHFKPPLDVVVSSALVLCTQ